MSKSIDEATTAVKDYLKSTNRPYSPNDIFNNLQNKFSKAVVIKALDALVETAVICERLNGKQKIYFLSQENMAVDNNKLKEMDNQIDQLTAKMNKLKESIVSKEQKMKLFKGHVPIGQYERQLDDFRKEIAQLKDKLQTINEKSKNIDPETQLKVKSEHTTLITEWRKRKRLASQAIDMILDNCSKPKKALLEEVGVETDEDVNVAVPT